MESVDILRDDRLNKPVGFQAAEHQMSRIGGFIRQRMDIVHSDPVIIARKVVKKVNFKGSL